MIIKFLKLEEGMSEQMVEAVINGSKTSITQSQLNEYMANPNYRVISESGVFKILQKLEG